MPEQKGRKIRRETLVEKLVRRSLETVGGSVDSVFGRGKKPDALPATSDLSERLRRMIDSQAQINKDGRKLAPHLISLKYAWGQTSDEFQVALRRLKNELLLVAIDFINDNRFSTLAPVKIESKADILTTGFTMSIGFDEASLREAEQVEIPVEIYARLLPDYQTNATPPPLEITVNVTATLPGDRTRTAILHFLPEKKATLTVGRIKETDLYLDDDSVSKHHASLAMNAQGILRVADIGSTNGTFLNGTRISYGKAYEIQPATIVGFGDVTTAFEWKIPQPEPVPQPPETEAQSDVESANATALEANQSGIKIGVKTATTPVVNDENEADEPATVFGAGNNASDAANVPATLLAQNPNDIEPETLNRQPNLVPEAAAFDNLREAESVETSAAKPAAAFLSETNEAFAEQPTESNSKGENQDFTQSLETNQSNQTSTDKSLLGFDSLLGKAIEVSKKTDEPTKDAIHISNNH